MDEFDRLLEDSLQEVGSEYREDMERRRDRNRRRLLDHGRRFGRPRAVAVGLAGMALIAGAAVVAVLVVPRLFDTAARDGSVAGGPRHPAITAVVEIPSPRDLALHGDSVWVSSGNGTLTKIDVVTNVPAARVGLSGPGGEVGVGVSEVLVGVPSLGELVVVDAESARIERRIRLTGRPVDDLRLSVGSDAAWIVVPGEQVFRIDLGSMEATALELEGSPVDIAARGQGVWLLDSDTGLSMLDPITGSPLGTPISVGTDETGSLFANRDSLWIARGSDDTVTRINQASGVLTGDFGVPGNYIDMALNDQAVWMLTGSSETGTLTPLDLESGTALSDGIEIDGGALEVGMRRGVIWIVLHDAGEVLRIDPGLVIAP